MAYMTRLGLWGLGTPFPDFTDFLQAIDKRLVLIMLIATSLLQSLWNNYMPHAIVQSPHAIRSQRHDMLEYMYCFCLLPYLRAYSYMYL